MIVFLSINKAPRHSEGGAPRSESQIYMIASGNHTISITKRPWESVPLRLLEPRDALHRKMRIATPLRGSL